MIPNVYFRTGFSATVLKNPIRWINTILMSIKIAKINPAAMPKDKIQTGVNQLVTLMFWASISGSSKVRTDDIFDMYGYWMDIGVWVVVQFGGQTGR